MPPVFLNDRSAWSNCIVKEVTTDSPLMRMKSVRTLNGSMSEAISGRSALTCKSGNFIAGGLCRSASRRQPLELPVLGPRAEQAAAPAVMKPPRPTRSALLPRPRLSASVNPAFGT